MKLKNGISLIVLIIIIIVMIIISGAIIISLNNTNVMDMGEQAVQKHNQKSIEEAINLAYQDLLIQSLGKVNEQEFAKKLEDLSKTYTEIQDITGGNGKVYYTLGLTGEKYQILTQTGETSKYIDNCETIVGDASLWIRSGSTITGYKGTGEQLNNVRVPNILKDENGNEIKITTISLQGIDFQGTLTIASGLIIKEQSFQSCNNLEKVVIGDNVQINVGVGINNIGSFKDCSALKEITMGRNIKITHGSNSNSWPFVNCTALETVTVESLSSVGRMAFVSVGPALKGNIIINEGEATIGKQAFYNCENIESITLPNTLKTVEEKAFYNCKNAKINFPESIDLVKEAAFDGCENMQIDLKLRKGIKITQYAFNRIGIKSLEIEDGIVIPLGSFQSCKNLETVKIGDNVQIDVSTEMRDKGLFKDCTNLKTVIMGKNIRIGQGALDNSQSFVNCPSLETVTVESLSAVGSRAFSAAGTALKGTIIINEGVEFIGSQAFLGCTNVEMIVLPNSLQTVYASAFQNCKIAKINFTENIVRIDEYAFSGCQNMILDLKIKEGVTLKSFAFNNSGIISLEIGDNITIPTGSFQACKNLETAIIGDNVTIKINDGYQNRGLFKDCTNLKIVTMGENISIDSAYVSNSWTFMNCTALETVTVKSLSAVGNRAFYGVGKALKGNIIINEGVTHIGNEAFSGCTKVESIAMPSTITTIGAGVFNNCTGLKILSINMTETAFANVTKGNNWNKNVPEGIVKYVEPATN